MAFSRSKSKRFNEIVSCAPPVGKYDVTTQQKAIVGVFDKSDRFKMPKEPQNGNSTMLHPSSSMDSLLLEKTPIKKLFDTGLKNSLKGGKSSTPCLPDVNRKMADMEKEIRHLLQQRTERDKLLNSKQSEVKKLDSRLQSTLKEKSALEAGLATADKQLATMRKANDVLKNKVDSTEGNVHKKQEERQKQLHETTNKLKDTEKEMSKLKDELTCQVRHLQADLEEASSKMLALEETKNIQEQLTYDAQKHSEEIEMQMRQLQGIINQLRTENTQSKQQLMDALSKNEILSIEKTEIKEDLENVRESLKSQSRKNESEASRRRLQSEETISDLQQQLTDAESKMNEDVRSSETRLEEEIARADDAVNQVAILSEKLEMTETMMNENLKALSTKYQLLEEEFTMCQKDKQQETEQLKFELEAVYSTSAELESDCDNLRKGNREIMDCLEKQREVGIVLQGQLMAAEQRMENTSKQHEENKEQMENDLLVLNETKNSLLSLNCELEEKVKSLEDENQLLHTDLSRHAQTFEEMTRDKTVLLNKMTDLSIQKQGLIQSMHTLTKDADIQQEQLKNLREDSEKLKTEKELALESKLEQEKEMTKQIHNVEDELKRVKQEFAKRLVETQTKCSSKEAEVERLSHQVESLEETLQMTSNDRCHLQQLMDEMEKEKTALNDRITQLQVNHLSEITHCDVKIETLYTNLKNSQEENEELKLNKKEFEETMARKINELEDNNRKMQQEFEEQLSIMQTKCTMAENESQRLNQQIHTLEANIENVMHERNQVQLRGSEREQENTALCGKIEDMEKIHNSKELEYQEQLKIIQEEMNNIEKELEKVKECKQIIETEMQKRLKERKEETLTLKDNYEKIISKVQEDNAKKESHVHRLEEKVRCLEENVQTEAEKARYLEDDYHKLIVERSSLSNKINHLEARNTSLESTAQTWSSRVHLLTDEQQELKERINDLAEENSALSSTISDLQEAAVNHVCNEEITVFKEEILRWQTLYENLQEKVAPFKGQLDQFELERKFLLCQSSQAQSEIQKLSQDYAKLLGHQNSKQKIQHVQKLKQENLALKQEVAKLREQNVKHMRQLKDAGEKNPKMRRFNPSEAFKNTKENVVPLGAHN